MAFRRGRLWRTVALAAVAAAMLGGLAPPASAVPDANSLGGPSWAVSSTLAGKTGVSYTYTFNTATGTNPSINQATMSVPTGTAGTPAVGTVTPSAFAGGSVSLTSGTLTYSLSSASPNPNTAVSIQVTGLTNTTVPGVADKHHSWRRGPPAPVAFLPALSPLNWPAPAPRGAI